jgi:hypothetical protein
VLVPQRQRVLDKQVRETIFEGAVQRDIVRERKIASDPRYTSSSEHPIVLQLITLRSI